MPDESMFLCRVCGPIHDKFNATHLVWPEYILGELIVFAGEENVFGEKVDNRLLLAECSYHLLIGGCFAISLPVQKCFC
jgi:hypothetical protein